MNSRHVLLKKYFAIYSVFGRNFQKVGDVQILSEQSIFLFFVSLTSVVYLKYKYGLIIIFDCAELGARACGRLLSEKKNRLFYTHNNFQQDYIA